VKEYQPGDMTFPINSSQLFGKTELAAFAGDF
jgi:hypothetical protein